jgi:predicted lipoprotein with Yx(FWY)xxD motif
MNRFRPVTFAMVAVVGLMAVSACARPVEATTVVVNEVVEEQPPAAVRLAVAEVGPLGKVVTDQNGRTLYRHDKDKSKPPVSNCTGECTKAWPPVVVNDPSKIKLSGVDQTLVGTLTRADGTVQITLNGWPLYRSAKDSRAGDVNGQGLNGTWYAATPSGKKAETQAGPPADGGPGN